MENQKTEPIAFSVPSGAAPASLISTPKSTRELAVVLPGAGYSCKMPLLFYSIDSLLEKGYRVLAVDKLYAEDANWRGFKTRESAFKYVEEDTVELFAQIAKRFPGDLKVLLARSLGTYQIACALAQGLAQPKQVVWQAPSLYEKWPVINACGVSGLGIIGTADERYETALPYLPKDRLVVEGADHSMHIPGDPVASIEVLKQVIQTTHNWLPPAR